MHYEADLSAAGRRAAAHPVPVAPDVAVLQQAADKQRSSRRLVVGSGIAAVALLAVALPAVLSMRQTTVVQNVAVGTGAAAAAQTEPGGPAVDPGLPAASAQQDDDADEQDPVEDGDSGNEDVRVEVTAGSNFAMSVKVITGDSAASTAAEAAAAADEILEVDGMTVWVSGTGDQRTVSALVEPDTFVAVTGNANQLDRLIDALRDGGVLSPGDSPFDDDEWRDFFGDDFDFDFDFDRFGDHDFGDFEFFFDHEPGDFPAIPDIEQFFENGDFVFPEQWSEGFSGCISIDGGDDFQLEIPEGCSSAD